MGGDPTPVAREHFAKVGDCDTAGLFSYWGTGFRITPSAPLDLEKE